MKHDLPEVMPLKEWKALSKISWARRSTKMGDIDKALEEYVRAFEQAGTLSRHSENKPLMALLGRLQNAIRVWIADKEKKKLSWEKSKRADAIFALIQQAFPPWTLESGLNKSDWDVVLYVVDASRRSFIDEVLSDQKLELKLIIRLRKLKEALTKKTGVTSSVKSTATEAKTLGKKAKTVKEGADEIKDLLAPAMAQLFSADLPDIDLPELPKPGLLLAIAKLFDDFDFTDITLPDLPEIPELPNLPDLNISLAIQELLGLLQLPSLDKFLVALSVKLELPDLDLLDGLRIPDIDLELPDFDLPNLRGLLAWTLPILDLRALREVIDGIKVPFPPLGEMKRLVVTLLGAIDLSFLKDFIPQIPKFRLAINLNINLLRPQFGEILRGLKDYLPKIPQVDWPQVDLPRFKFPDFGLEFPDVNLSGITIPSIKPPTVTIPKLSAGWRFARMMAGLIADMMMGALSEMKDALSSLVDALKDFASVIAGALKSPLKGASKLLSQAISLFRDFMAQLLGFDLIDLTLSAVPFLGTIMEGGKFLKKTYEAAKEELHRKKVESNRFAFSEEKEVQAALTALKEQLARSRSDKTAAAANAAATFGARLVGDLTVYGSAVSAVTGPATKILSAFVTVFRFGQTMLETKKVNAWLLAQKAKFDSTRSPDDEGETEFESWDDSEIFNLSPLIGCYLLAVCSTSSVVGSCYQATLRSQTLNLSGGSLERQDVAMTLNGIQFGAPGWAKAYEKMKATYADPVLSDASRFIRESIVAFEKWESWGAEPGKMHQFTMKTGIRDVASLKNSISSVLNESKSPYIYAEVGEELPDRVGNAILTAKGWDPDKQQYYGTYKDYDFTPNGCTIV